jgi:hypothetical protein
MLHCICPVFRSHCLSILCFPQKVSECFEDVHQVRVEKPAQDCHAERGGDYRGNIPSQEEGFIQVCVSAAEFIVTL